MLQNGANNVYNYFVPPVSKSGSRPDKSRTAFGSLYGPLESEEGMMLHCTFPQMFASFLAEQAKDERMFLLPAPFVIFHHNEDQLGTFEVELCYFGPENGEYQHTDNEITLYFRRDLQYDHRIHIQN